MAQTQQRDSPMVAVDGRELRRRRQLLGDNQAQFAQRCKVGASYISLIESGVRPRVSPRVYVRICDALGVNDRTELLAGASERKS